MSYPEFRKRFFSPQVTLRLFLMQVFSEDSSCRKTLAGLIAKLISEKKKTCSYLTGAYCQARKKLPVNLIRELAINIADKNEQMATNEWLWKNKVVKIIDGTTLSAPDTTENQKEYPQNTRQKPGLGFPILRLVGIFSLSTGSLLNLDFGTYAGKGSGETSLLKNIIDTFKSEEVALIDRYYTSTNTLGLFRSKKIDFVGRKFGARKIIFKEGEQLGVNDHIVTMKNSDYSIRVREVEIEISQRGFRPKKIILVTSFLDHKKFTKEDLAELYYQRWNVEVDLRSLKVNLGMERLKCKTPEMLRKEIWMHMLGYNIVRGLMCMSARTYNLQPRQISFKSSLQITTSLIPHLKKRGIEKQIEGLLFAISQAIVGDRPGRYEPRAVKLRQKPDRYLTVPRDIARKCYWHQNRAKHPGGPICQFP